VCVIGDTAGGVWVDKQQRERLYFTIR